MMDEGASCLGPWPWPGLWLWLVPRFEPHASLARAAQFTWLAECELNGAEPLNEPIPCYLQPSRRLVQHRQPGRSLAGCALSFIRKRASARLPARFATELKCSGSGTQAKSQTSRCLLTDWMAANGGARAPTSPRRIFETSNFVALLLGLEAAPVGRPHEMQKACEIFLNFALLLLAEAQICWDLAGAARCPCATNIKRTLAPGGTRRRLLCLVHRPLGWPRDERRQTLPSACSRQHQRRWRPNQLASSLFMCARACS